MILSKKELKYYIQADQIMAGYSERSIYKRVKYKFFYPPILSYLYHMRCCSFYKRKKGFRQLLFIYHYFLFKKLGLRLGFSIGYDVFGYGLYIPHYGTIVVNDETVCGNFCVLHTSICIGGSGKTIGDALYVAAGAKIMGSIKLGNNISVAAQSLVNKDCMNNNVLLAGSPATIKKKSVAWYERDGLLYSERVRKVKDLKIKYGL